MTGVAAWGRAWCAAALLAIAGAATATGCFGGGRPAEQAPPNCDVTLVSPADSGYRPDVVLVQIGGRRVSLGPRDVEPEALRVYASGDTSVMLAYSGSTEHGPTGSSTFWRLSCRRGEPTPLAHQAGADFGHSVLTRDGRGLLYSGPDGIYRLDLATRATRRLTQAASTECAREEIPARDVVIGWADSSHLAFQRGCGWGHEWRATDFLLSNPGEPGMAVAPAPIPRQLSIAGDAGGGLWLADASCESDSMTGRLLFSADLGDHWQVVDVPMLTPQPIRRILADRLERGRLLVLTAACGSDQHVDPAWVYVTEDGAKSFRPIAVPEGIPGWDGQPDSEQDPLQAIAAPDGSLGRLRLYGNSRLVAGGMIACWESSDGGRSWKSLPPVSGAPAMPAHEVRIGRVSFSVGPDGVYRAREGEVPRRVYPPR